jgi:hypothetical protein
MATTTQELDLLRAIRETVGQIDATPIQKFSESLSLAGKEADALEAEVDELGLTMKIQTAEIQKQAEALGTTYDRMSDMKEALREYLAAVKEGIVQGRIQQPQAEKMIATLRKQAAQIEAVTVIQRKAATTLQTLTGITDRTNNSLLMNYLKLKQAGGGFKDLVSGIVSWKNVLNVGLSTLAKFKESIIAVSIMLNETTTSYVKQTAASEGMTEELRVAATSYRHLNISQGDVLETQIALTKSVMAYTKASEKGRKEIQRSVLEFKAMGISTDISTTMLDTFMSGMGKTAEESDILTGELFQTAQALEMIPSVIMQDFVAAQPRLIAWGDRSIDVFKNVAAQAKATSITVDTLLKMAESMDTFEGAATAAAKLNAVLGGGRINALELFQADPDKKIMLLRTEIDKMGVSWDSLGRREKTLLSSAAGFNSIAEAAKFFTTSLSELENQQSKVSGVLTLSGDEREDLIARSISFKDALLQFAQSFAILTKPLELGMNLLTKFFLLVAKSEIAVWAIGLLATALTTLSIIKLYSAFKGWTTGLGELFKRLSALPAAAKKATDALIPLSEMPSSPLTGSPGTSTIPGGTMASPVTPAAMTKGGGFLEGLSKISPTQWLSVAVAIAAIGGAIALTAVGLSQLAKSIDTWEDFVGIGLVMGGFAGIMLASSKIMMIASLASAKAFAIFAGGLLLIGGAIALVGFGFSFITDSITKLSMIDGSNLLKVAGGLAAIMATLAFSGFGSVFMLIGLTSLIIAINSISKAFDGLNIAATNSFANALSSIYELVQAKDSLGTLASRITDIKESIVANVSMPENAAFVGVSGGKSSGAASTTRTIKEQPVVIKLMLDKQELGEVIMSFVDGAFDKTPGGISYGVRDR